MATWIYAWAMIAVYIVASLVDPTEIGSIVLYGLTIAVYGLMGALLRTRVPHNRMGPLLLVAASLMFFGLVAGAISIVAWTSRPPLPGAWLAGMISDLLYVYSIVLMLIGIPLIFPNGHLLTPRWRWLAVLTVAAMGALAFGILLAPGALGPAEIENPLAIPELVPWLDVVNAFASLAVVVGFGGAALSVVLRYRRGRPLEREQVKWLAAVAVVGGVAFTVAIVVNDPVITTFLWFVGFLALVTMPIAIAIAITRYRLYDIDRIVSRTIGYGVVTFVLFVVFGGTIIGLQTLISGAMEGPSTEIDPLVVAASTLVVAALFNPVRVRVQAIVDRRFHRARYDAERTVAGFAGRLRDELDLGTLTGDLRRTTVEAVEPSTTGIWLRAKGHA